jgi:hypothetical protein
MDPEDVRRFRDDGPGLCRRPHSSHGPEPHHDGHRKLLPAVGRDLGSKNHLHPCPDIEEVALATQRYAGIIVVVSGNALIHFGALTLKSIKRAIMKVSGGGMSESPYMAGC